MALVAVVEASELGPGKSVERVVGVETYVVCNWEGQVHALEGICPHRNGPLGAGNFADGRLICPYHGWEFDCQTGEYDLNPKVKLKKFPVVERDGWIHIDVLVEDIDA
jgi:nitrite reductase (NADH) small subunit